MSKSLDNFFLVRDVMKEYSAETIRFYLLNGHYRSPIDFSDTNLRESVSAYRRLEGTYQRIKDDSLNGSENPEELINAVVECKSSFMKAMNDDFNTREALASLFQLSRVVNSCDIDVLSLEIKKKTVKIFESYGREVLGLFTSGSVSSDLVNKIEEMILLRNKARTSKDWAKSDSIRNELLKMGIQIEDSPEGTKWRQI